MKTIHTEGWNKFSDNEKPYTGRFILVKNSSSNFPYEIKMYAAYNAESIQQEFDQWKYCD